jgi:hypothetical protein
MHTRFSLLLTISRLVLGILIAISCIAATTSCADPVPPPKGTELEAAVAAVKAIYKDKADKARTPAERTALARDIFGNREATANLAERYAVEFTALNLATKGDDAMLLMNICDELATSFEVDRIALFTQRVGETSGPVNPTTWPKLSEKMNGMLNACLDANRYDEATELATAISQLAKRARDAKATAAATALRKTIADRKKAQGRFEELSTAANSLDADSKVLMEFGRLLCFTRNDWAQGVRYLARTDDPLIASAAALEGKATTPETRMAAADAWVKCVEKASPTDRAVLRDHAALLYGEAIPSLSGLAKVKAEKALEDVLNAANGDKGAPQAQWIVIFRAAKPDVWNTDASDTPTNYAIPLSQLPPIVKFVRLRRANGECVILTVDKAAVGGEFAGDGYAWNGTNLDYSGARMLGIADSRNDIAKQTGAVAIARKGANFYTGWGFGHRVHHGGEAELCWNGKWIPREPLEIAVLGRPLTPTEERFLLR